MKKVILMIAIMLSASIGFAQKTTSVNRSTSISISDSDDRYTVSAHFDQGASQPLKKLIIQALAQPHHTSNTTTTWKLENVYQVDLKTKSLYIDLDKQKASASLTKSFLKLGKDLERTINQHEQRTAEDKD